ncbi:hypothetical protein PV733_36755 [Streptomyces europaeiscabiei]|uniref:hypothetical protein n=1 Tax=Streptomyces europaeiscabiei TaxID=146819 RepID=UPI0029A30579|nr:hypothetical protein [Streptomyces europaeiscabiei]MDX3714382.1 hypothetical protein [Streptomyces europaeiscabiei]
MGDHTPALAGSVAARQLTDRIKVAVSGTWLLIQEAYTSRAWAALGYETWDAYVSTEFKGARLALPREDRSETVLSLRAAGMSVRAIGTATGLGVGTVHRELADPSVPSGTVPERVLSLDGRNRPARVAAGPAADEVVDAEIVDEPARPEPPKPKRRPLPEAFADATHDFVRIAERLDRLHKDDRFTRNRPQTRHRASDIVRALVSVAELTADMELPTAEATEEARRWWAASLYKISDALRDVANSIEQEQ